MSYGRLPRYKVSLLDKIANLKVIMPEEVRMRLPDDMQLSDYELDELEINCKDDWESIGKRLHREYVAEG